MRNTKTIVSYLLQKSNNNTCFCTSLYILKHQALYHIDEFVDLRSASYFVGKVIHWKQGDSYQISKTKEYQIVKWKESLTVKWIEMNIVNDLQRKVIRTDFYK